MRQPKWAYGYLYSKNISHALSCGDEYSKKLLQNVHTQILLILLPTSCPPCKVVTIFPVFASKPRINPSSPFTNTPAPLGRQTTCGVELLYFSRSVLSFRGEHGSTETSVSVLPIRLNKEIMG